jgi:hypothetical protein
MYFLAVHTFVHYNCQYITCRCLGSACRFKIVLEVFVVTLLHGFVENYMNLHIRSGTWIATKRCKIALQSLSGDNDAIDKSPIYTIDSPPKEGCRYSAASVVCCNNISLTLLGIMSISK